MDASGLKRVYEFLRDPAHWTQIELGRDENGKGCDPKDAVSCCLLGACEKFSIAPHEQYELARLVPGELIGLWNDNSKRTHKEVLALLATAILKVESKKDRRRS